MIKKESQEETTECKCSKQCMMATVNQRNAPSIFYTKCLEKVLRKEVSMRRFPQGNASQKYNNNTNDKTCYIVFQADIYKHARMTVIICKVIGE